ncbi:MAG: ABC transporter substrate-binding protein [Gammaproteobacteria bacterium]|nr:ABC transporter substrate-binding protein [Gammaproteobacteria bacterium]
MTAIHISALRHSAFYSPLLYTIGSGLCQKEGLEPHYAPATPDNPVPEAIRAGRVHLAQSAVAASFAELEAGDALDIVHFAQINERDGFFLAGREPEPAFDWQQLVGREVLVDHFFQPLAMFKYACHRQGLNFDSIKVIDAGDVGAIDDAFRAGQGEYVHQQGPAPQQMEQDGIGHVVASVGEVIGPVAFSSLCASREWLESDMARAFMNAYREGREQVISRPASEVASVVQPFLPDIDRPVLEATITSYQAMGTWSPGVEIPREAYETLLDVFLHSGVITQRHAYDAVVAPPP